MVDKKMATNSASTKSPGVIPNMIAPLGEEYTRQQKLFEAQPALVQRFLENQARQLADAVVRNQLETRFSLPNMVVLDSAHHDKPVTVPAEAREQLTGGVFDRLARSEMRNILRQKLTELEDSTQPTISVSAGLIRFATAVHMISNMLPSGRTVVYRAPEGEEIPSVPVEDNTPGSAITAESDAIAEESGVETDRGELQVPFVPFARKFYLPQWVAFDEEGHLLVKSINEAESNVASMQRFLQVLHYSVSLAPYMVADPLYQQKRYGMLGQLVNQGRSLAIYEVKQMISVIRQRVESNDLNRGLSLSMPYFDDQDLELCTYNFEVIPAGRIMFVPAFVVRAAQMEKAKVAQDTRKSASTRKYLLAELAILENAFVSPANIKSTKI
jgi:hypothetical protein